MVPRRIPGETSGGILCDVLIEWIPKGISRGSPVGLFGKIAGRFLGIITSASDRNQIA